jgi:hypothetical protein
MYNKGCLLVLNYFEICEAQLEIGYTKGMSVLKVASKHYSSSINCIHVRVTLNVCKEILVDLMKVAMYN